jgi:branched-chain amino acid transport system permease protein
MAGPVKAGAGGPASAAPLSLQDALKSALAAAFITLLIAVPMLAYRTIEGPNSRLALVERWPLVVWAVAIVFTLRFVTALAGGRFGGVSAGTASIGRSLGGLGGLVGPLMLAFAIVLPFLPFSDRYIMEGIAIPVLTYIMLGWGLNIVVGLAGLLDLGYVAFYAVGAYSYALLAIHFGFSFWICLPLAGILAAFWGVLLGFPVLRLRGDYLAIVTLAFGEIIRIVLINWTDLTGGPNGLSGIPRPSLFGLEFKNDCGPGANTFCSFFGLEFSPLHRIIFLYYIILVLALVTNWVTIRLRRLPVGRAWEALREDEIACRSLGINTTTTKLTAFAIGAMFAGFAGSFFATRQAFISPESFTFMESAIILAIVVLGGMGSQIGVAIAAFVLTAGLELFRNLEFLKLIFGNEFDPTQYRMLIFGAAMVIMMRWKPRGFVGNRTPTIALKERRAISGDLVKEGHG